MWAEMCKLYQTNGQGTSQPSDSSIEAIILRGLRRFEDVWLVIDALDECDLRRDTLAWIQRLLQIRPRSLRLLVTSRKEEDIRHSFLRSASSKEFMAIEDILNADIEMYLRARLYKSTDFQKWNGHEALGFIEDEIMNKSDGMLVYCVNISF